MTSKTRRFDLLVVGSGPGGEGAAMQAAKEGLNVGVVEKYAQVGGNCTHKATIPSKALRQLAFRLTSAQSDPLFNHYLAGKNIRFSTLLKRAANVITQQVERRKGHYHRNNVEVIRGLASFADPKTLLITDRDGNTEYLSAKGIILATGSRPFRPSHIDFSHPRILDSDTILQLEEDPKTVTIVGAGVVGCEYTSIFKALGKKVNLINSQSHLLSFLDDEISNALSYHLRDKGVLIRDNEHLDQVESRDDRVILHLKSGKKIPSDIVLFATGRAGNIEDLKSLEIGIKMNERKNIIVNKHYQSSIDHIYAVGDLTGFPNLASSAYDQGRFAASHFINPDCDDCLVKDIPVGIYTSPEISCVGKTEKELTKLQIPYEVGQASFKQLARAQITGQTVGMLKVLFHSETLEILGIHCFGQNAAEIVHIGQAIMAQKEGANSLKYFIKTTFNYPTMAEAYRVAALNGLNRLCH